MDSHALFIFISIRVEKIISSTLKAGTMHVFVNSSNCLINLIYLLNVYLETGTLLVSNDTVVTKKIKIPTLMEHPSPCIHYLHSVECKIIWYQNRSTHFVSCGTSHEENIQTSGQELWEQWRWYVSGIIKLPYKTYIEIS